MFVTDRFVWVHFPKTAGTTTRQMFNLFPRHARHVVGRTEHPTFADAGELLDGRQRAMNIRRLPHWTLSYLHYTMKREHGHAEPDAVRSALAEIEPEGKLLRYLDGGHVDHWLRVEHLEDDFVQLMSLVTRLGPLKRRRLRQLKRRNQLSYERDLAAWFEPASLDALYERSPTWAALERRIYGTLLSSS